MVTWSAVTRVSRALSIPLLPGIETVFATSILDSLNPYVRQPPLGINHLVMCLQSDLLFVGYSCGMANRAAEPLPMSRGQREVLKRFATSRTASVREVDRARMLLAAAVGVANIEIAADAWRDTGDNGRVAASVR